MHSLSLLLRQTELLLPYATLFFLTPSSKRKKNGSDPGLMTRGLAEITRLATKRGANPLTMLGLAGMGDLVLTCTGSLSRNRTVGVGLGKGQKLDDILEELGQVAEGVLTTKSAWALAQREGIDMPVLEQVYALLYEGKNVDQAVKDLFSRDRKAERG